MQWEFGAKIRLGNGNSFSIDTGLDKKDLMDKAAGLINSILPPPPRATRE